MSIEIKGKVVGGLRNEEMTITIERKDFAGWQINSECNSQYCNITLETTEQDLEDFAVFILNAIHKSREQRSKGTRDV